MKIGFIGSGLNLLSGSSKPIFELMGALNKKNIETIMISDRLSSSIQDIQSDLENKNNLSSLQVERLSNNLLSKLARGDSDTIQKLSEFNRELDLIVTTDFLMARLLRKNEIKFNCPLIFLASNNLHLNIRDLINSGIMSFVNLSKIGFSSKLFIPKIILGRHLSEFDSIITTSNFVMKTFEEYHIKIAIELLPIGVNIPDYSKNHIGKHDSRFSFYGWGSGIRGLQDVLHAFTKYREKGGTSELNVFLQGQHGFEERYYENRIKNSEYSQYINIEHFTRNIYESILSSMAVLLPFRVPFGYSHPPLTILESMALGRVVISTNVGCIPELIDNEIDGFTVNPKNPDKTTDILLNLHDEDLKRIGENALKRVQTNNSWDFVVKRYIDFFEEHAGGYFAN